MVSERRGREEGRDGKGAKGKEGMGWMEVRSRKISIGGRRKEQGEGEEGEGVCVGWSGGVDS
jgi:hypothetical protein